MADGRGYIPGPSFQFRAEMRGGGGAVAKKGQYEKKIEKMKGKNNKIKKIDQSLQMVQN